MENRKRQADVCLILEGTYPFVAGGVSTWTHNLIQAQSHLSFHLVALLAPESKQVFKYKLPANVCGLECITLQELRRGRRVAPGDDSFYDELETLLMRVHRDGTLGFLRELCAFFAPRRNQLGSRILMDSPHIWRMVGRMYENMFPGASFLDFFWSWKSIFSALFSVLLAEIPPAKVYHTFCTGYAGLLAARAHVESGSPCLLTEHGIYTNERRVELSVADWLHDGDPHNLSIVQKQLSLRDYWLQTFIVYSQMCYAAAGKIITLFEENQEFQAADGADPAKMAVIPNGVEIGAAADKSERPGGRPPTIALIGRVVPIKDVKGFIQACRMIKGSVPDLRALIIGPTGEDEEYFSECSAMIHHLELSDTVSFTGLVRLEEYWSRIDVVVLTSISEAQPLVLLEAGAASVPAVAVNVGACREILLGRKDEDPPLGAGGIITPLSNPGRVAEAITQLLLDHERREACGEVMRQRVARYYNRADQDTAYRNVYRDLMAAALPQAAEMERS